MPSEALPANAVHVKGPDLSNPITLEDLLRSYETIGFQATGLAKAILVVEEMVRRFLQSNTLDFQDFRWLVG